jgi:hypothetical protein
LLRRPHVAARFQRTRRRQLTAAEQAAFELAFIPLTAARALVELHPEKGDRKLEGAALRYPRRYMDETDPPLTGVAPVALASGLGRKVL